MTGAASLKKIILTEKSFISGGANKKVYKNPKEPLQCIKICYNNSSKDMERELYYRRLRAKHDLSSTLLPAYYGTVATNMGLGYVFEYVCDADGSQSLTLNEFLEKIDENTTSEQDIQKTRRMIARFKREWLSEGIVINDMCFPNFMVQQLANGECRIRIIDDIGSQVLIPLEYYFAFFARKKVLRYWERFCKKLHEDYPELFGRDFFAD